MTDLAAETRSPHFARQGIAQTYGAIQMPRIFAPWARILLELVPTRPADVVLDVATGPGTVARQAAVLAGSSGRVVGVDVSAAMLDVGRGWATEPGAAAVEYIEASATAIPVPDGAFDVAYCQQGLQHMADPQAALREMHRALKPGGRLGIALWVRSPFAVFREAVAGMGLPGSRSSNLGQDADELSALLRSVGFGDVAVQRRELESVLEGGVSQALELAAATSASAGLDTLSAEQQAAARAAMAAALEPFVREDGVHLTSSAHLATARR